MKISSRVLSVRDRTPFNRVLTCILLLGIIYSATFGAVHSHGNTSVKLGTNISADLTANVSALSEIPFHNRSDGNECLICVLHRQFSSSTVHTPFFVADPSTQIAGVSAPTIFYRTHTRISRPIARLSGRAPPLSQI
ncbi:MAG: hypothetical protein ABJB40_02650 [Acidobacteriota bacterium]